MISKLNFIMFGLMFLVVMIEIVTAAQTPLPANAKYIKIHCPQRKLTLNKAGSKLYYLGAHVKVNWFQALLFCQRHGMELVSIPNKTVNDNIQKFLIDSGFGKNRFWTGAFDLGEKGKYHWAADGDLVTYSNWSPGQPDNFIDNGEVEHCVELVGNVDGTKFLWNDATCSSKKYFLCEV